MIRLCLVLIEFYLRVSFNIQLSRNKIKNSYDHKLAFLVSQPFKQHTTQHSLVVNSLVWILKAVSVYQLQDRYFNLKKKSLKFAVKYLTYEAPTTP